MSEPTSRLPEFCEAVVGGRAAEARALLRDHPGLARDAERHPDMPGRCVTALAVACAMGDAELARQLLDLGAPPNDSASLFLAAAEQQWGCFDLLRDGGGDVNALEKTGSHAPLHWVLDVRFSEGALDGLLERGADIGLPAGPMGETPLHVAVRRRRREAVQRLCDAGVDLDAVTTGGMTAYRHAVRRNFPEIADMLRERGADATQTAGDELALALHARDWDTARGLVQRASEPFSEWNAEECRLLPDLAGTDKVEAVQILLDAGIGIESRGLEDGTALHQAAWFGQPEMIAMLLERGARIDVRGEAYDSTPLGWAAHGSAYSGGAGSRQDAYVKIVELLLAAGASFPGDEDVHDHPQLGDASEAVAAVLRRHGWEA